MDLQNKKIIVTGGAGFLGSHVIDKLKDSGCRIIPRRSALSADVPGVFAVRSQNYDLTVEDDAKRLYQQCKPDIVIHLAATVGGIGINREKPGTFYYNNLMMGTLLIEQARQFNIDKFVTVGTICAYPKYTPVPFKEENLWDGYPEETNAPYGIAKKALLVQTQAYADEFGFNGIYLLPVNLYGPRDNFDPASSHVIPALIKKCIDARENEDDHITVWGSGTATREFLYVKDAAEAIVSATKEYESTEPINIGNGREIIIKDLVEMIIKFTNFKGDVNWDDSYPDGQPRRALDCSKAQSEFGFKAKVDLEEGLQSTIDWYEEIRNAD